MMMKCMLYLAQCCLHILFSAAAAPLAAAAAAPVMDAVSTASPATVPVNSAADVTCKF